MVLWVFKNYENCLIFRNSGNLKVSYALGQLTELCSTSSLSTLDHVVLPDRIQIQIYPIATTYNLCEPLWNKQESVWIVKIFVDLIQNFKE